MHYSLDLQGSKFTVISTWHEHAVYIGSVSLASAHCLVLRSVVDAKDSFISVLASIKAGSLACLDQCWYTQLSDALANKAGVSK